jgi:rhamnosyltransferase
LEKFTNICSVIITYNPTDKLFSLINSIKNQVNEIIVIDNNSKNDLFHNQLMNDNKFHLLKNKENLGVAKALNQGFAIAIEKGYKWVLMFDQDSNPFSDIINNFILSYNDYPFKNKIGMIGLNAYDQNNNVYVNISSSNNYKERDYLITSGCLISTEVYNLIGKFNESYFIDNVDIEYSLRVRKAKFILLITKKPGMIHKAGDTLTKKIFGFEFESSNHNSLRRYYMTRNHFCLSKEYFYKFPFFIMKLNIFFFLSIISMLIIEKDRKNKLKSILKGLFKF